VVVPVLAVMFVSQRVNALDIVVPCAGTTGAGGDAVSAGGFARVPRVVAGWVTVTVRVVI
jgi:hypothetical protein